MTKQRVWGGRIEGGDLWDPQAVEQGAEEAATGVAAELGGEMQGLDLGKQSGVNCLKATLASIFSQLMWLSTECSSFNLP